MNCKICNRECKSFGSLGTHIVKQHHISVKDYYDSHSKQDNEGKCIVCNYQTEFKTISEGYRKTCGKTCAQSLATNKQARDKARQTCLGRYGVENASMLNETKRKVSETQVKRLLDPKERTKISIATKIAMQKEDVKQRHLVAVRLPKSKETLKKMSNAAKQKFINDPTLKDRLYTSERNEKISKSKIIYWKTHPEERKRIMDIWKARSETKLETKMYDFLLNHNLRFEKRYELGQRQYDAYLPDHNLLLEFDGEFWHKQSLDECKYNFQTFNFYNDRRKDEIAKSNNIPLLRIRENEPPEKILDYINNI